jgi:hypothetical protein
MVTSYWTPMVRLDSFIASQKRFCPVGGFLCSSLGSPSVALMRNDDLAITASVTAGFVFKDCQMRIAAQVTNCLYTCSGSQLNFKNLPTPKCCKQGKFRAVFVLEKPF